MVRYTTMTLNNLNFNLCCAFLLTWASSFTHLFKLNQAALESLVHKTWKLLSIHLIGKQKIQILNPEVARTTNRIQWMKGHCTLLVTFGKHVINDLQTHWVTLLTTNRAPVPFWQSVHCSVLFFAETEHWIDCMQKGKLLHCASAIYLSAMHKNSSYAFPVTPRTYTSPSPALSQMYVLNLWKNLKYDKYAPGPRLVTAGRGCVCM
jgi:hypothetical protein